MSESHVEVLKTAESQQKRYVSWMSLVLKEISLHSSYLRAIILITW